MSSTYCGDQVNSLMNFWVKESLQLMIPEILVLLFNVSFKTCNKALYQCLRTLIALVSKAKSVQLCWRFQLLLRQTLLVDKIWKCIQMNTFFLARWCQLQFSFLEGLNISLKCSKHFAWNWKLIDFLLHLLHLWFWFFIS